MRIVPKSTHRKHYLCGVCNGVFFDKTVFDLHRKSHNSSFRHKCKDCDQTYLLLSSVHGHAHVHCDSKPHKCTVCERRYDVESMLRRHKRLHKDSKSYKCSLCETIFRDKQVASKHLRKFHRVVRESCRRRCILVLNPDFDSDSVNKEYLVDSENEYPTVDSPIPTDSEGEIVMGEGFSQLDFCSPLELQAAASLVSLNDDSFASQNNAIFGGRPVKSVEGVDQAVTYRKSEQVNTDPSQENASCVMVMSLIANEVEGAKAAKGGKCEANEADDISEQSEDKLPEPDVENETNRNINNNSLGPLEDDADDFDQDGHDSMEHSPQAFDQDLSESVSSISDGEWEEMRTAFSKSQNNTRKSPRVAKALQASAIIGPGSTELLSERQVEDCASVKEEVPETKAVRKSPRKIANKRKRRRPYKKQVSMDEYDETDEWLDEMIATAEAEAEAKRKEEPKPEKTTEAAPLAKSWALSNRTARQMKTRRRNTLSKILNWNAISKLDLRRRPSLRCHICNNIFVDEASMQEHMSRHEGTKTNYLKCKDCPKVFSSKHTLVMHEKIHSEYRPFHCKECGKGFIRRTNLKIHMRSHTGELPFICEICGKRYKAKMSLAYHTRSHPDINKFGCLKCHFCFATKEELEEHEKVHARKKYHECHKCKKSFQKAYLLEFHLQRDCADKKYTCDVCGKSFNVMDYLRVHQRVHTGEKPFSCEICGKLFSQSANLTKHLKIHNNIRDFECDVCHATFIEKAAMIHHKRTHTGEKPHMCDVCGSAFTSQSYLVVHRRSHTGERPYSCDQCGKSFPSSGRLRDHYRTHTGEKPYKCPMCDKSFALSKGLVRHKRLHTGERPHKCDICGERFMRKDRLRKHLGNHVEAQVPSSAPALSNSTTPAMQLHPRPSLPQVLQSTLQQHQQQQLHHHQQQQQQHLPPQHHEPHRETPHHEMHHDAQHHPLHREPPQHHEIHRDQPHHELHHDQSNMSNPHSTPTPLQMTMNQSFTPYFHPYNY